MLSNKRLDDGAAEERDAIALAAPSLGAVSRGNQSLSLRALPGKAGCGRDGGRRPRSNAGRTRRHGLQGAEARTEAGTPMGAYTASEFF